MSERVADRRLGKHCRATVCYTWRRDDCNNFVLLNEIVFRTCKLKRGDNYIKRIELFYNLTFMKKWEVRMSADKN